MLNEGEIRSRGNQGDDAIEDATVYYPAHEAHQKYLQKKPQGYCNHVRSSVAVDDKVIRAAAREEVEAGPTCRPNGGDGGDIHHYRPAALREVRANVSRALAQLHVVARPPKKKKPPLFLHVNPSRRNTWRLFFALPPSPPRALARAARPRRSAAPRRVDRSANAWSPERLSSRSRTTPPSPGAVRARPPAPPRRPSTRTAVGTSRPRTPPPPAASADAPRSGPHLATPAARRSNRRALRFLLGVRRRRRRRLRPSRTRSVPVSSRASLLRCRATDAPPRRTTRDPRPTNVVLASRGWWSRGKVAGVLRVLGV